MGYDDNTPLRGVTGGGLPAEIWRQTMEDIHADMPARPLPMIDPFIESIREGPATADRPDLREQIMMEVLGTLSNGLY
jgi:membrane peptidoglycan carboxypeptidase